MSQSTVSVSSVGDSELLSTLIDLALRTDAWEPLIRFEEERTWMRVDAGFGIDAWLIMWGPGHTTGMHDHGAAIGYFTVLRGSISETVAESPTEFSDHTYSTGDIRWLGPGLIHDMFNASETGTLTLHVYRGLTSMTEYEVVGGRVIRGKTRRAGNDW
ncbi:MAG: cysteine dioxygenase [Candidatus Nanopelagicales bacterium]